MSKSFLLMESVANIRLPAINDFWLTTNNSVVITIDELRIYDHRPEVLEAAVCTERDCLASLEMVCKALSQPALLQVRQRDVSGHPEQYLVAKPAPIGALPEIMLSCVELEELCNVVKLDPLWMRATRPSSHKPVRIIALTSDVNCIIADSTEGERILMGSSRWKAAD